jgi:outer membrane biosynthesis protein TonB
MTTATTLAVPLRTSGGAPARKATRKPPVLRLVPKRRSSAAKMPFVLVVVTILVGGLLGLLLLNTLVAQGSFRLHDLSKSSKALQLQEQDLAKQVEALQAPAALAAHATSLGMVQGGPPAFLKLPTGTVLGQPTAGVAPVVVAPPTTTTATKPAVKPAVTPAVKPVVKPATKPATKPAAKPAAKRTTKPPTTAGAHR